MAAFAEGTTVTPEKSQSEIMGLLRRYGANNFAYGEQSGAAVVAFTMADRQVRFTLPLPTDPAEFHVTPGGRRRDDAARKAALEAEVRRRWRALALSIKAKLEVVETGIATFEDEFLSNIVLPGGATVGESIKPGIEKAYLTGAVPTSLLAIGSGR